LVLSTNLLSKDVRLPNNRCQILLAPPSTRETTNPSPPLPCATDPQHGSPPPVLPNSNTSVRKSRLAVPQRLPLYSVLHPQARETTPPVSAQQHYLSLILLTSKESAGQVWARLGSARLAPQQLQGSRQARRRQLESTSVKPTRTASLRTTVDSSQQQEQQ